MVINGAFWFCAIHQLRIQNFATRETRPEWLVNVVFKKDPTVSLIHVYTPTNQQYYHSINVSHKIWLTLAKRPDLVLTKDQKRV